MDPVVDDARRRSAASSTSESAGLRGQRCHRAAVGDRQSAAATRQATPGPAARGPAGLAEDGRRPRRRTRRRRPPSAGRGRRRRRDRTQDGRRGRRATAPRNSASGDAHPGLARGVEQEHEDVGDEHVDAAVVLGRDRGDPGRVEVEDAPSPRRGRRRSTSRARWLRVRSWRPSRATP